MLKNPHLDSYRKFSHGRRAKINERPQCLLGSHVSRRLYDQIAQSAKYILILFFIIVHILSAHYHYAKFDNWFVIKLKKNKFANNLDLQT